MKILNSRSGSKKVSGLLGRLVLPALIVILLASCLGLAQDQATEPLSERFIYEALRNHALGEDFLIAKIRDLGVDFQLTDEIKNTFKKYGASEDLLATINDNYRAGDPDKVSLLPGGYEGKIGEGKQAKLFRFDLRTEGNKLTGTVNYDKKSGKITDGECKAGEFTAQFEIGKEKGVLTGTYKDGRIRGDMTFGGTTQKVKLNWTIQMAQPQ